MDIAGKEGELARLRAAVLADAALADELLEIWRPEDFAARAADAAGAVGVRLDAGKIAARLAKRPGDAVADDAAPPPGWLPARVTEQAGELVVDWVVPRRAAARRAVLRGIAGRGGQLAVQPAVRPVARVWRARPASDAAAPAGLIFHMSRCGSTLVSQMLAASDANLVVSEAPPIDAVVRMDPGKAGVDAAGHAALLAAIVGAFGHAGGGGRRLFVKLDSWHTRALPLFRRAFPSTPWVFLYRDPTEVMVSAACAGAACTWRRTWSRRASGRRMATAERRAEDYAARVLAAICEAALAACRDGGGLLVNYSELPGALADRILPHFGVDASPEDLAVMRAVAERDAKHPRHAFAPDSAAKQAAATPAIRAAVRGRLADVYARLEAP